MEASLYKMLDGIIYIKDLLVETTIGVNPPERSKPQNVLINLEIHFDPIQSAESDSITDTINYSPLIKNIVAFVKNSKFHLLESLAQELLKIVAEDPMAKKAIAQIEKPDMQQIAKSVAVKLIWQRK